MPVYAYDVPPHLYIRLAPGIAADIAVIGPLAEQAYEQLLNEPALLGGMRQSGLAQVLLELSGLPEVRPAELRWTASTWVRELAAVGVRHLAVVLPSSASSLLGELRSLVAQSGAHVLTEFFFDQGGAIRWISTRLPGVGATSSPDAVVAALARGARLEAVAMCRAMYGSLLPTAIEMIERLEAQSAQPSVAYPASLVPSTELPRAAEPPRVTVSDATPIPAIPAPITVPPEEPSEVLVAPVINIPAAPADAGGGLGSQPTLMAKESLDSLAAAAHAQSPRPPDPAPAPGPAPEIKPAPVIEESITTAASPSLEGLVAMSDPRDAEEIVGTPQRALFDALARVILSGTWFSPATFENEPSAIEASGQKCFFAYDSERAIPDKYRGQYVELSGPTLGRLLRSEGLIRFAPDRPEELQVRKHQFVYLQSIIDALGVEAALRAASWGPEEREKVRAYEVFWFLLERDGSQPVTTQGPEGGRFAVVFTLPDALRLYITQNPEPFQSGEILIYNERGEYLLDALLALPIAGVIFNPCGPTEPILASRAVLAPSAPEPPAPAQPAPAQPAPAHAPAQPEALQPSPVMAPTELAEPEPPSSGQTRAAGEGYEETGGVSVIVKRVVRSPAAQTGLVIPGESVPQPPAAAPTEPAESLAASQIASSGPLPQPAPAAPTSPRRARSPAEARYFLDVRGYRMTERQPWLEQRGAETVGVFEVTTAQGELRREEFLFDTFEPAPQDGPFGPGPSRIFGPGEFLTLAEGLISSTSGSPLGLTREELVASLQRASMAYSLVNEALRFCPAGQDSIPASALMAAEEKRYFEQSPGKLRRGQLEAMARSYATLATQLDEALRARGS